MTYFVMFFKAWDNSQVQRTERKERWMGEASFAAPPLFSFRLSFFLCLLKNSALHSSQIRIKFKLRTAFKLKG
ncbi:hypothetical protein ASF12_08060 [Paenibacillus sp. Leaf72]|nr:hypothetical protein ASF12_08060 [Paenibacillus sp. Leaf72]